MRTADSTCLLCQVNKATATNSHIIPKFMGKSMLAGAPIIGYIVDAGNSDKPLDDTQDTLKEDHIICIECEKYFSHPEGYISRKFHGQLRNPKKSSDFKEYSQGVFKWKSCEQVNQFAFRLFIYSIVWRCHISSLPFSLEPQEAETLRQTLLTFKSIGRKEKDLFSKITANSSSMPLFPFIFFTTEIPGDANENIQFADNTTKNPYRFALNEYILLFSFEDNPSMSKQPFNNNDNSLIKVGFFQQTVWEAFQNTFKQMLAENLVRNGIFSL